MAKLTSLFEDANEGALFEKCLHFRPLFRSCLTPVSVGDLIVVEQKLCGYELGEIAQIENVMAKERKEFSSRDLTRITETTETSIQTEIEESESSKVDERFSLSVQSQEAQRQQTAVSGNISASYKAPAFSASITANASYTNSKDSSYSTSQVYAKNITQEASKRIKESISQIQKVTVVTESTKTSLHGFNNTDGNGHIRGVYRWVEKLYKSQLVDYGKRLFLQFMVPEPAFYLRDLGKVIESEELDELTPPVHPRDLADLGDADLTAIESYQDIDETNYGKIAALYDVTDIAPPPPEFLIKGKGIAHPEADQGSSDSRGNKKELTLAKKIDSVIIDPGYHLVKFQAYIPLNEYERPDRGGSNAEFQYGYYTTIGFSDQKNDVNLLLVNILNTTFSYLTHNDSSFTSDVDKDIIATKDYFNGWIDIDEDQSIEGEVPITVGAEFEGKFYFNLIYKMQRNAETLVQWQIETYEKILQGYRTRLQEYEQKLKAAELSRDDQIGQLTVQPREEAYREIEAHELRKHCIDILTRHTAFSEVPKRLNTSDGAPTEINLISLFGVENWQASHVNGVTAAHFEEAYEWENITFKLYPYFWTDPDRWNDVYREPGSGDALFDQFMKAGFARVVVPIRPNYERSVLYFLRTNMIWAGGELPGFDDDTHLSVLDELHESRQLQEGEGRLVGEPWEVQLPTSFVYLQETPDLPRFDCSFPDPDRHNPIEYASQEVIKQQEAELAALVAAS